jgi:hypothetical protein
MIQPREAMAQAIHIHLEEDEIVFTNTQDRASSFRFALLLLVRASNLSKSRITERYPNCTSIRIDSSPLTVNKVSGYPLDHEIKMEETAQKGKSQTISTINLR